MPTFMSRLISYKFCNSEARLSICHKSAFHKEGRHENSLKMEGCFLGKDGKIQSVLKVPEHY